MSHSEQESAGSRAESRQSSGHVDEPLRLVHHHPGYLRVRAGIFLEPGESNPVVTAAQTAAEAIPGFRSWTLNPRTGSVVIEYEPDTVDADDLLRQVAKSAGLQGVETSTGRKMSREELVSGFLDSVQGVNRVVSQLTGDRADLRELTPVALAAIAVVSFVLNDERGRLPQWSSSLYHSYRVFMQWHRPETRARERTARQEEERAGFGNTSANPR